MRRSSTQVRAVVSIALFVAGCASARGSRPDQRPVGEAPAAGAMAIQPASTKQGPAPSSSAAPERAASKSKGALHLVIGGVGDRDRLQELVSGPLRDCYERAADKTKEASTLHFNATVAENGQATRFRVNVKQGVPPEVVACCTDVMKGVVLSRIPGSEPVLSVFIRFEPEAIGKGGLLEGYGGNPSRDRHAGSTRVLEADLQKGAVLAGGADNWLVPTVVDRARAR